jgi:hypothetical protein
VFFHKFRAKSKNKAVGTMKEELTFITFENAGLVALVGAIYYYPSVKRENPGSEAPETYFNHKRIKAKLKGMSPVNYRTHTQIAA